MGIVCLFYSLLELSFYKMNFLYLQCGKRGIITMCLPVNQSMQHGHICPPGDTSPSKNTPATGQIWHLSLHTVKKKRAKSIASTEHQNLLQ